MIKYFSDKFAELDDGDKLFTLILSLLVAYIVGVALYATREYTLPIITNPWTFRISLSVLGFIIGLYNLNKYRRTK